MGTSPFPDPEVALASAPSLPADPALPTDLALPAEAALPADGGGDESSLRALRRVRTLARLRRAGLSERTLTTILPDWVPHVEQLQARVEPPVEVVLPD